MIINNEKIKTDVAILQKELTKSDYKVLKMYEYSLAGKVRPYDITTVHAERQSIRDQINSLESQIKDVKTWDELANIIIDNRK